MISKLVYPDRDLEFVPKAVEVLTCKGCAFRTREMRRSLFNLSLSARGSCVSSVFKDASGHTPGGTCDDPSVREGRGFRIWIKAEPTTKQLSLF